MKTLLLLFLCLLNVCGYMINLNPMDVRTPNGRPKTKVCGPEFRSEHPSSCVWCSLCSSHEYELIACSPAMDTICASCEDGTNKVTPRTDDYFDKCRPGYLEERLGRKRSQPVDESEDEEEENDSMFADQEKSLAAVDEALKKQGVELEQSSYEDLVEEEEGETQEELGIKVVDVDERDESEEEDSMEEDRDPEDVQEGEDDIEKQLEEAEVEMRRRGKFATKEIKLPKIGEKHVIYAKTAKGYKYVPTNIFLFWEEKMQKLYEDELENGEITDEERTRILGQLEELRDKQEYIAWLNTQSFGGKVVHTPHIEIPKADIPFPFFMVALIVTFSLLFALVIYYAKMKIQDNRAIILPEMDPITARLVKQAHDRMYEKKIRPEFV